MTTPAKTVKTLDFDILHTPYYDGEVEHGIFIAHQPEAGAAQGYELDVLVDENKNLRGVIISLQRENLVIEVGTTENPVPVEMLEQLKTETGVLIVFTDDQGEVVESTQLNFEDEGK